MKKLVFILSLFMLPIVIYAQAEQQSLDKKTEKEMKKEKRKLEKKAYEDSIKQVVAYMVENRSFVLEADYISGKSGARHPVSSNLNFIIVDSAKSVIQLGNPSSSGLGYNGIGGITVDGNISQYRLDKKETKRGTSYTITLYVNTNIGIYDILLWVSENGSTSATIRGNTSGQLSYSGNIVPVETSRIYKGHSYP